MSANDQLRAGAIQITEEQQRVVNEQLKKIGLDVTDLEADLFTTCITPWGVTSPQSRITTTRPCPIPCVTG